ncbi:hypothetical protein QFC22_005980 [Naganishia vaughanmartiniae]|uniref:Uncharacterized protein n=1 Tax=Naganishia vaughanmartiniae TaxID=1424756 RepID=A0ACC2WRE5_9TREE|nr:hypothetical protein QFC22_005980 [Naganishia vaughanmartiniae]
MHQCLIFDSDTPGARLIGIEYVVPEETFQALDEDEKRYWHSHKFGESVGLLVSFGIILRVLVHGGGKRYAASRDEISGSWQYDIHPDFPLGPPQLMMAYTADEHVDQELLGARDAIAGTSTSAKREYRKSYLPSEAVDKMPLPGADGWLSGRTIQLEAVERDVVPRAKGVRSKIDGTKEKA